MGNRRLRVNRIFRFISGGNAKTLRVVRKMYRHAKKTGQLPKFREWVRGQIPQGDSPERHVHPRHTRSSQVRP